MSWIDSEGIERGGDCNECGESVTEPHHSLCEDCYAEREGWIRPARPERPDREALVWQREDRERITTVRLVERIARLERRVEVLEHITTTKEAR